MTTERTRTGGRGVGRGWRERMAGEALAGAELARLAADPVFWGLGLPRGDGRLVLVLPGLFGSDLYLQPLHDWLGRTGYLPVRSTLRVNAGCPERLSREAQTELERRMSGCPGPVAIIGHSRGGILGRAIAARLGERVSHLFLLGSPVGGALRYRRDGSSMAAAPLVVESSLRARRLLDPDCEFPECGCPFPTDLGRPLAKSTSVVTIFSPDDPIVPASAAKVTGARPVAVSGTHIGLVYNRDVYREIALTLAGRR